jgi:hypothetical protein
MACVSKGKRFSSIRHACASTRMAQKKGINGAASENTGASIANASNGKFCVREWMEFGMFPVKASIQIARLSTPRF